MRLSVRSPRTDHADRQPGTGRPMGEPRSLSHFLESAAAGDHVPPDAPARASGSSLQRDDPVVSGSWPPLGWVLLRHPPRRGPRAVNEATGSLRDAASVLLNRPGHRVLEAGDRVVGAPGGVRSWTQPKRIGATLAPMIATAAFRRQADHHCLSRSGCDRRSGAAPGRHRARLRRGPSAVPEQCPSSSGTREEVLVRAGTANGLENR